jgi:hypothetical protein
MGTIIGLVLLSMVVISIMLHVVRRIRGDMVREE